MRITFDKSAYRERLVRIIFDFSEKYTRNVVTVEKQCRVMKENGVLKNWIDFEQYCNDLNEYCNVNEQKFNLKVIQDLIEMWAERT